MAKTLEDRFKDYWRDDGSKHDAAYQGRAITAERAFKAGHSAAVEQMKEGCSEGARDAERRTDT